MEKNNFTIDNTIPVILHFEHYIGKKIVENECIVTIVPGNDNTPTLIQAIVFKHGVKKLSYNQLFDLFQQLQSEVNKIDEERKNLPATVGDVNPTNLPSTKAGIVKDFFGHLKNGDMKGAFDLVAAVGNAAKGEMTDEEKKNSDDVLKSMGKLFKGK